MPARPSLAVRLARAARRLGDRALALPLHAAAKVLPALPTRAVLALSDVLGTLVWALDRRGRRCGTQGLEAVLGAATTSAQRGRVLRASYRNAIRNEVLLFHLQPLDPERYRRFVRVDPEDDARFRRLVGAQRTFVLVSGHLGNWELLLATRAALPYAPPMVYLAETTGRPSVDRLLERLRAHATGGVAMRKGGAMALRRALEHGQSVCMLVDRNVSRLHGGRFVPFLGLPARTTPLPAMLAHWYRVPLAVALLLPDGRAHWRLWISDDLAEPRTGDEDADVDATLRRMNDVLSRAVLADPGAWAWMLKRWKSRPGAERGPYPAYSVHDPERPPA